MKMEEEEQIDPLLQDVRDRLKMLETKVEKLSGMDAEELF